MTGRRIGWVLGAATAAFSIGGCDADEADEQADLGESAARDIEANGFRLNGFRLNGFHLNGFRLNGLSLDGVNGAYIKLEKLKLPDGPKITASWLSEGNLHAETEFGQVLSGAQLIGAELVFELSEGQANKTSTVKIVNVEPLAPGSEVLLYDAKIREGTGLWEPLCLDHLGLPTEAILIDDVWDPATGNRVLPRPAGVATFACRDAALAKCVEWGYRPWHSLDGIPLSDYHQACTRAVRADYCGDGVSHTADGVLIHILDELGIQDVELNALYAIEAEWGPNGARCLNEANTRLPDPQYACAPKACGGSFDSGGLLQTGKVQLP